MTRGPKSRDGGRTLDAGGEAGASRRPEPAAGQDEARSLLEPGHPGDGFGPASSSRPNLVPETVIALQRIAGNEAVGRLLSDPGRQTARPLMRAPKEAEPAGGVLTQNPQVGMWSVHVEPGGQGAGIPRIDATTGKSKVFPGDKAIIKAQFVKLEKSDHDYIGHSVVSSADVNVKDRWADARTLEWQVGFSKVGAKEVSIDVSQDEPIDSYTEEFQVVADLADFTLACVEAQSTLRGKFDRASRHVNEAASAFRKAYAEQQDDLDVVLAHQKMIDDLIFGAVFAAAGGFVGGALGGWLKGVKDGAFKSSDWLIDTAKDTVKFGVRSTDRLRGGGGVAVQGDSHSPGRTDPEKPRGQYKAAGKDPLDFLADLSARIAGEGEEAQATLTKLISDAREARNASSKADFDEDPVAIVSKDLQLESIVSDLPIDKSLYLKGLWKTWLETYAWRTYETGVLLTLPAVKAKIDKAAKQLGESADDWFAKWADPEGAWNAKKQKALEEQMERDGGYDIGGP